MLAVLAGTMLPILPVQALWINMTTAVLLGLPLAFETKELDIMERPSRNPASPLLNQTLVVRVLLVSTLLIAGSFGLLTWELSHGESDAAARTVVVNVIVFGALFYLFNCRSLTLSMFSVGVFSNHWLLVGVSLMTAFQFAFTYVPFMNRAFGSEPIGLSEWSLIVGSSILISLVVGMEKWVRRLNPSRLALAFNEGKTTIFNFDSERTKG
jgi:magnesium-transporting ATPase (P-type)